MNRSPIYGVAPLLLLGALAAAACADDDSATDPKLPEDTTDASAPGATIEAGASDSSVDDAGPDAATDAVSDDAETGVPGCSKEGWCLAALPTGAEKATLVGVWGDGQGVAWAVSKEGSVLRWDGTSWSVARSGTDQLYAVWGSGPTDVWVTSSAGILHGTGPSSASLAWTLTPLASLPGDATTVLSTIGGTSATDVWAGGSRNEQAGSTFYGVGRVLHYLGEGHDPAWELDTFLSTGNVLPPDGPSQIRWEKIQGTSSGDLYLSGKSSAGRIEIPSTLWTRSVKRRVVQDDGSIVWNEMYDSISPNGDEGTPCASFRQNANLLDGATGKDAPVAMGARGDRVWLASGTADQGERYAIGTFDGTASTTAWSCNVFGLGDSIFRNAIWVAGDNDAWSVGPLGRVNHFDGTTWKTAGLTATTLPIVNDLYDIWGDEQEIWVVGNSIALRKATRE